MFKYAIVVAAVAVSVALAGNIPTTPNKQEPMAASSNAIPRSIHHKPDAVLVAEVHHNDKSGYFESALLKLLGAAAIPKKLLTSAIGYVTFCLKHVNLKGLLKGALIGAVVAVAGAIAAVAVAGLVSVVSAISAALPYAKLLLGGKNGHEASESQMDLLTDIVLAALNKYDTNRKA